MSDNFTSHFSADDAALVLIDFQPQMFMGVESHDRNAIKNNLQIIAKSAKLLMHRRFCRRSRQRLSRVRSFRRSPKGFFRVTRSSIARPSTPGSLPIL